MVVIRKRKFRRKQFADLTNFQWEVIKELVDTGRKRKHSLRMIINGILKLTRTGVQWRNLDEKYPPRESVYYYFRKWQNNGTWTLILMHLVQKERVRQGKEPKATRVAVDSQSVKISSFISKATGFDGGKKINGRKRHIAVDSLGLPLAMHVSAANTYDGFGGIELLWQLNEASKKLELILGDKHYRGDFIEAAAIFNFKVLISQRPETAQGFVPEKGRWQVERSFAWFNFFRRLSKDYEKTVESSVNFMQLAFIDIILARLT